MARTLAPRRSATPPGTCLAAEMVMARTADIPTPRRGRGDIARPFEVPRRRSQSGATPPEDDARRPEDASSIDEVVERLSRDMSAAVNRAPDEDRDELRDYAADLVREDTAPRAAQRGPTPRATLSFFALAVWLAIAGAVLSFLLPPVGVVCFVMAGLAAVLAAVLGRREPRPERSAQPGDVADRR